MLVTSASVHASHRYTRVTKALEWPMALLALAVIPALLLDNGSATPRTHLAAVSVNWFVWVAFCGEFVVRLSVAPERRAFIRRSWFDLLIIAISPPFGVPSTFQGVRALRALRLVRLMRAFGFLSIGLKSARRALHHRKFHYVLLLTAGVMLLGATGLYTVERPVNSSVKSFDDALWWAITTTTTVGYGDIYPVTGEGRLIAVLLMLTGIGVIGVFTATIANLFMIQDDEDQFGAIHARLDTLHAKLDRLLAERDTHAIHDQSEGV
jgi:voltage-gated potassium channel